MERRIDIYIYNIGNSDYTTSVGLAQACPNYKVETTKLSMLLQVMSDL